MSLHRIYQRRRGAALVEAAIVLPVMIMLIGIVVDYSRIFYGNVTLSGSARNGALHEFDPLTASQSHYLDYAAAAGADATNLTTKVNYSKTVATSFGVTNVSVDVSTSFKTLSSWFILPAQKSVKRTVTVRQAQLVPD